ncbi:MAG TPA: alpha/beta hydrolase, partial [Myxococcota bacterium]|nr:alpha/beta hydrolase [Myxococcota bacterium]
ALRAHHRLISWNYRGHGLSRPPADPDAVGIAALRADLAAVLDAYGLDRAVLFGHSMGVQVILDFALDSHERVAGLVPICGSYGRPLDTLHGDGRIARLFPLMRDMLLRWPHPGQRVWRRLLASRLAYGMASRFEVNGKIVRPEDFKPYFEHLSGMDAGTFVRLLDRIQSHSVEDRLGAIRVPTLIIAGERDTFTPAWLSHRMHLLIPGAELMVVPGGTHVVPIEIPELVNLRIERFLEGRVLPTLAPSVVKVRAPQSVTV